MKNIKYELSSKVTEIVKDDIDDFTAAFHAKLYKIDDLFHACETDSTCKIYDENNKS